MSPPDARSDAGTVNTHRRLENGRAGAFADQPKFAPFYTVNNDKSRDLKQRFETVSPVRWWAAFPHTNGGTPTPRNCMKLAVVLMEACRNY